MADDIEELADGVSEEAKTRLVETVEDLRQSNAALRAETEMFERFIRRQEAKDDSALSDGLGGIFQDMGMCQGRKARLAQEKHRLTMEQKCDVAEREHDTMREELQHLKESSERQLHSHQATMEEAEIRLSEVKKASYEFDRDVAKVIREKKGGMMDAEKVIRYIEDRIKAKDALVEKLRLKNGALRVQKRKLELQLKQKEEVGEARHHVDFQQLKIKNTQYLQQIDVLNQDLLRLKLLAGSTQQILHSHKNKLQQLINESKLLSNEIASRDDVVAKMEEEKRQAEHECAEAEVVNAQLKRQLESFSVPPLLDYIKAKSVHGELEQTVRSWERKVVLAEMALRNHTKMLEKIQLQVSGVADLSQ
ncbi:coiled-coil domain-containing protein 113 [Anguilla anguilla]|uniref:coiled-coil domain-containing protein 113 n=1 Tax=Anguilla anguilla TaxID=7936 RepID=UPI0015AF5E43|nr:coiled-coil domain-containing protein 113 [Anguilla anguilla]